MRKHLSWLEILLSVVVLGAYIYAALSDSYNLPNRWFIRDDAYYYYKVAQNISEGRGSTFDGIHPTNGYHPLWMLICIPIFALARYDFILPLRILVLVTGVLQVATALLLYRLIRSVISAPVAVLAAAYWVFDSYILVFLYKTGVESSIALFFIVLLLYRTHLFERTWRAVRAPIGDLCALGAVAALAVFGRLDLIFFAVIMGIWIVFRGSALRYLLPLDIMAIFASTLAAFLARLGFAVYYEAVTGALATVTLGLVTKIPVFYLLGLYQRPSSWRLCGFLTRMTAAALLGSAITSLLLLAGDALGLLPPVSRVVLVYDAGLTLASLILIRGSCYLLRQHREPEAAPTPMEELRRNWLAWLRDGSAYFGLVAGSLALYMVWNKLAFGSFSPVSGQVKRWWGSFLISVYGGPARTWLSFFGVDAYGEYNAWQPATNLLRDWSNALLYREGSQFGNPAWQRNFAAVLAGAALLLFLVMLAARQKATRAVIHAGLIPLFVGSVLQTLSYNATGYASPKEWYWLTEPVMLVILGALLSSMAFDALRRLPQGQGFAWAVAGALALYMGGGYWRDALALYPYGRAPADAPYAEVIPFLEEHTRPGDIIGMTGGGNVGYFLKNRTIVNMDGLINSTEYFKDLKARTGSEYLYESGMRYVFANPAILEANPYRGQYEGRLEGLASWGGKDLMKLLPAASE